MALQETLPRAGCWSCCWQAGAAAQEGHGVADLEGHAQTGGWKWDSFFFSGLGPTSTTLAVTYRSQPGPTLHLRSSNCLTGDSVCPAQPHWWDLSIPSGWTLSPSCPGWWCCTEPLSFCFQVYTPFSYILTVFLQCPLSQVAQPGVPLARSGVFVVWWILLFAFAALLCFCLVFFFLKNNMLLVSITQLIILESSCKLHLPIYFVSMSDCKLFGQGISAIP